MAAGAQIMKVCAEVGGSISGEHGIGLEKADFMPFIFSAADLAFMQRLKSAFNPTGLCNPGKVFPTKKSCGEAGSGRLPAAPDRRAGPRPALLSAGGTSAVGHSARQAPRRRRRRPRPVRRGALPVRRRGPHARRGRVSRARRRRWPPSSRVAAEAGVPIMPWGGGTAVDVGPPPPRAGIVLGLRRLGRLLEHEPGDLTVTAEAGHDRRGDLQTALRRARSVALARSARRRAGDARRRGGGQRLRPAAPALRHRARSRSSASRSSPPTARSCAAAARS